jgi:anaerobic ribonucleoside-triphosphate reductase activating protein
MKYHNITHDDMLNGDGIRVVLWVAGCEHHCKGCQNPMTWNPNDGKEVGAVEWEEICTELSKDYVAGITFSGGDPLHPQNRIPVANMIQSIKKQFPHKTIWLYTGYTWEEIMEDKELTEAVKNVDVLVDGRFNESLFDSTCHWVGSKNQRVINAKESMKKGKVIFHESN